MGELMLIYIGFIVVIITIQSVLLIAKKGEIYSYNNLLILNIKH